MTQSSMGAQSVEPTFYWYDYETFGVDPRKDRPAQFAGRRTRLDFRPFRVISVKFSTVAQRMISCLILKAVC